MGEEDLGRSVNDLRGAKGWEIEMSQMDSTKMTVLTL